MTLGIDPRPRVFYLVGACIHAMLAGAIAAQWGVPNVAQLGIFYCGTMTAYTIGRYWRHPKWAIETKAEEPTP